jgi:hypothetical protein
VLGPLVVPKIVIVGVSGGVLSIGPISRHVSPAHLVRDRGVESFSGAVGRVSPGAVLWPKAMKSEVHIPRGAWVGASIIVRFSRTELRLPRISQHEDVHGLCGVHVGGREGRCEGSISSSEGRGRVGSSAEPK